MGRAAAGDWLSVEAEHEGRPLLIRARSFAERVPADPSLQMLMVMERAYAVSDGVALPGPADTEILEWLQRELFEEGEALGLLMLVLVETGAGRVRYYAYVRDPDAVMARIDEVCGPEFEIDLAADEDPYWNIYTQIVEGLT